MLPRPPQRCGRLLQTTITADFVLGKTDYSHVNKLALETVAAARL